LALPQPLLQLVPEPLQGKLEVRKVEVISAK
jgi:hypothetical protein